MAFRTVAALSLLLSPAWSQDWPSWRGAGRDGKLTGFQPPATWPAELKSGWQFEVGEGNSSPVLVKGKLYLHVRKGDDEVTLSLDADTGRELWKHQIAVKYEPSASLKPYGAGPISTPTVADDRLYTFGISGILTCRDAKSGEVVWSDPCKDYSNTPDPTYGTALSPLVTDGMCIVHVGRAKQGEFVAFDAATGKLKWRWKGDGPASASPIAVSIGGKKQILAQTETKAIALSMEGQLLWQMDYDTGNEQNSVTPLMIGDVLILSGTGKGITAYNVRGAKPEQTWQTNDASLFMSSPISSGGSIFGFSEKKRGQFFCLNSKTGDVTWSGGPRQGHNAAILDGGSVIMALTAPEPNTKGPSFLVVFEANEKEYKELARYKVAETPAFAHPVVSGKSIFVKDRTKLTQWTLP